MSSMVEVLHIGQYYLVRKCPHFPRNSREANKRWPPLLGFSLCKNLEGHVRGCPIWALDWVFATIIVKRARTYRV